MSKSFAASLTISTLLGASGLIGAQTMGTSHPEELNDTITTSAAPHYVKPSPAVPAPLPATSTTGAAACVQPTPLAESSPVIAPPIQVPEVAERKRLTPEDPDSGIVEEVAAGPNEIPSGALLHVALSHEVSTTFTERNATFHARLLQSYQHHGKVLLPAGAVLTGRVAELHGGNRLHGGPAIHMVPESVTLPDGSSYRLTGQVVDLPHVRDANVNDEGTIHGRTNVKGTATGVGLTTASATVAGAVIGGPVGAGVGAGIGAGVATVWWLKHEQEQTLAEGTEIVFSLNRPLFLEPVAR